MRHLKTAKPQDARADLSYLRRLPVPSARPGVAPVPRRPWGENPGTPKSRRRKNWFSVTSASDTWSPWQ